MSDVKPEIALSILLNKTKQIRRDGLKKWAARTMKAAAESTKKEPKDCNRG